MPRSYAMMLLVTVVFGFIFFLLIWVSMTLLGAR